MGLSAFLCVYLYPTTLDSILLLKSNAGVSTQVHVMISSTTVKSCLQSKLLPKTINNGLYHHTYIIICKYMYSNLLLTRNKIGECRSCREESGRLILQCMNKKIALKEESELQSQVKNMSMTLLKDMGPQNIIAGGLGVRFESKSPCTTFRASPLFVF